MVKGQKMKAITIYDIYRQIYALREKQYLDKINRYQYECEIEYFARIIDDMHETNSKVIYL
jgi:hypothetical protein